MDNSFPLYYLYCVNRDCQDSIFHRMVELQLPLEQKSMDEEHFCTCCGRKMESALSQALFGLLTEAYRLKNFDKRYSKP